MKYDYHIAVIGAGSGGLVVTAGAANLGAKVVLIESHKMGGDCLNYGCVPSKSFLKSAHLAADIAKADVLGIGAHLEKSNLGDIMGRVRNIIKEIEPHDSKERFESLGAHVIEGEGHAVFEDPHTIRVGKHVITAKNIVIATGSTAAIPPIPGLDDSDYLTNVSVFQLDKTPDELIVLGAGPIGLELGQGFAHLGAKVTVIDMLPKLFMKDDNDVGDLMQKTLESEGVTFRLGYTIVSVSQNGSRKQVVIEKNGKKETLEGDEILLSLGRVPQTKKLGLEQANVSCNSKGYLICNNRLQTSQSHIYGVGDVVGPYQFTHMAGYQAGIVLRNIIFRLRSKVNYSQVPWVTFTKPEVAQVGHTVQSAKKERLYTDHITVPLSNIDRAKTDHDRIGFLKLVLGRKNKIIGASIVGEKAGDMISLASLAINKGLKPNAFMNLIFPYPIESEIYKFAAFELAKKQFKPWMKQLIKKVLL